MNVVRRSLATLRWACVLVGAIFFLVACTGERAELGTAENPVKLFFVPSVDVKVLEDSSARIKDYLEANTPYKFRVSIPTSYVAVVEAFGTERADVAALNTFGYIMAHERYQARAAITVLRFGMSTYRAQFIARADSGIESVEDLAGKRLAYVDPASTSGYLLPLRMLRQKGIEPGETMFAMRHDSVVSMVYQGQVDAGATFHSPVSEGEIQDARRLVKTQYPDVEEQIKIIGLTDPIPNDPFVFRAGVSMEMQEKIVDALMAYVETDEGRQALNAIYGVTALQRATDADYDEVRDMLRSLGVSARDLVNK